MFNHQLFKFFNCHYSSQLFKRSIEIAFKKGEVLFLQETIGDYVYYVNRGTIKIVKTSSNGDEKIFSIYQRGQFVALSILFNPPHYYPASGIAVDEVIVHAIPRVLLESAIVSSEVATRSWFCILNQRLENIQQSLTDQVFIDTRERFKKMLTVFAKSAVLSHSDYLVIAMPLTKQEMADLLSVRRETFSRLLTVLKEEDLCYFEQKQIKVNRLWLE